MLFSEGSPANTEASRQQMLQPNPNPGEQESERERIFELIDNLLSFEACLYHQILPLKLENNQLLLGMVHPQDRGAVDYVDRIVSYINYTLITQEIPAETLRNLLSVYLSYKNTLPPENLSAESLDIKNHLEPSSSHDKNEEIDYPSPSPADQDPQSENGSVLANSDHPQSTDHVVPPIKPSTDDHGVVNDITVLQLQPPEAFTPIEMLTTLPPKKVLEELLARVLSGGIGRLYLERQPYEGRIIWSDNGVLQSVLENIPLSIFQGVLNELKRFVSLPVTRHAEPRQIEKECLYQQYRVLLRIRVMPGSCGEEATLQVLRGAALKFYQQQQLISLSKDILGITQHLSHKLHELNERLLLNPVLSSEQSEAIATLNQLVENLDQQIKVLTANNQL